MNPLDEQNDSQIEETNRQTRKGKSRFRGWLTTIVGGIIGSVLTLTVTTYTPYFETFATETEQLQTENISNSGLNVQKTAATNKSANISDMVADASKSIVGIVNMKTQTQSYPQGFFSQNANTSEPVENGSGTGVIFKKDRDYAYIVTNNHVIEGAEEIEITVHGGEKTTAELIGTDSLTDIAVLKIDSKYATNLLAFGDSSTLRAGETVLAIGNPLGLDLSNTVTQGIVSAVDRTIEVSTSAGNWDLNVIQTDAAINPGNSGGALVNTSGQLIGLNSLKIADDGVEGLGFAIPSNNLVPIIDEIMEKGEVVRPYIGVGLVDLTQIPQMYLQNLPNDLKEGAMVSNVAPNSPASKAGLAGQDVIVSINGTKIKDSNELRKYLYTELEVGDRAQLEIYRGDEKLSVQLELMSNSGQAASNNKE
jgi:serine protease Do